MSDIFSTTKASLSELHSFTIPLTQGSAPNLSWAKLQNNKMGDAFGDPKGDTNPPALFV